VVSREKGTPEGFRGVAEGLTKFLSPETFTFYGEGVDGMFCKGEGRKMGHV
jgi:hypothetical protein